jgi:hypothetical protein
LELSGIGGQLELPSIDDAYFKDPNEFTAAGEDDQRRLDQKSPVTCHQFILR